MGGDKAMMTLKAARVNKRLTQKDASKRLGISEETLRNYETHRSYPDVPMIKKIESVYGVGYDEIIFLPDDNC